jgi:PBP4 family serine-type D-alanyl-D-alanine carboxypeptidase
MSLNENCIDFYVSPGKLGKPIIINTHPTTNFISIQNESITVNDTTNFQKLKIKRDWGNQKNNFIISGNIMDTSSVDTMQRNIHDPSLFVGTVFAEMLVSKGLNIKHIIKGSVPNDAMKITEHESKPIVHSLNGLMKRSENLTAELIVKYIGSTVYDTIGTWNNGLLAIKTFLHDTVGIDTNTFSLSDGSGMSRYNYSSPNHFISVLSWAYNNKNIRNQFIETFPIGGVDGTLEERLENIDTTTTILAKTGSLAGVSCLSGYIISNTKNPLAFSILMNGFVNSSTLYRKLQDEIVYALTKIKL